MHEVVDKRLCAPVLYACAQCVVTAYKMYVQDSDNMLQLYTAITAVQFCCESTNDVS